MFQLDCIGSQDSGGFVSNVDLYPTICDLAGLKNISPHEWASSLPVTGKGHYLNT